MNFKKIFLIFAFILTIGVCNTRADFWKDLGKDLERIGQHVRDATIQVVDIAERGANVYEKIKGDKD